jgi:hypothetical protein
MKRAVLVLLLGAALALAACSPISVNRDYDSETDFSGYSTYRWVKQDPNVPSGNRAEHALLEKRVKAAVDAELRERGFRMAGGGKPDFLVAWYIGAEDKVNVERYGYRYGPRGRWYGTNVQVHHYKEGTLIIDLVDPDEKLLVWRSTAVGSMRYFTKGEHEVQSSVEKMLGGFPPE